MNISDYQKLSTRTMPKIPKDLNTLNCCLGISGEAGELIDHIKKVMYQGRELNRVHIVEEVGDLMFYIANLCTLYGLDMSLVLKHNIEKLNKRYPNGFSVEDSERRVDKNGED